MKKMMTKNSTCIYVRAGRPVRVYLSYRRNHQKQTHFCPESNRLEVGYFLFCHFLGTYCTLLPFQSVILMKLENGILWVSSCQSEQVKMRSKVGQIGSNNRDLHSIFWPIKAWIVGITYAMITVVEHVGCIFQIGHFTMGLVIIAAGTSVPDALSSILVARDGFGDMAVR